MARPKKHDEPVKVTLGMDADMKVRLEEAAALFGAREGRRLSLAEAVMLALDDSPSLRELRGATAKLRPGAKTGR